MLKYKIFNLLPEFGTNTYLVWCDITKEAMIVDMAAPAKEVIENIHDNDLNLKYLVCTHGHADHIGGNDFIKKSYLNVPLLIHSEDAEMLTDSKKNLSSYMGAGIVSPIADRMIEHNAEIYLGNEKIRFIHTPGHTRGSICLHCGNFLISGDTLFAESIGRTDLPGGDYAQLINSVKNRLFILSDDLIVLSGHGVETTIGSEKIGNPFVGLAARL